jgi:hypothetical protein
MQNQYATGKTIYKGGLLNAHSGTLDPSGYIDREQKRSGLAALALRGREGNSQPAMPVGHPIKKQFNLAGISVSPTGKLGKLRDLL